MTSTDTITPVSSTDYNSLFEPIQRGLSLGLNQRMIAEELGVTKTTVSRAVEMIRGNIPVPIYRYGPPSLRPAEPISQQPDDTAGDADILLAQSYDAFFDAYEAASAAAVISSTADAPKADAAGIDSTLAERGTRYGEFKDQAVYAQGFADIAAKSPNWAGMAPDQKEGLSVIFNKIGRILNGDPDYSDSWHDIAGYATLVDKRLKSEGK
jgi:hypothetical protein